ncbi:MAG: OmpA family protein [Flavobacteriales bacterium]|nr:OmpA family protein [Flavobacteriales bacterium]
MLLLRFGPVLGLLILPTPCLQAQDLPPCPERLFVLRGVVVDRLTDLPIPDAMVSVVGTDGSQLTATTDTLGAFTLDSCGSRRCIQHNTRYSIAIKKLPYFLLMDQISTVGLPESTTFFKEYYMHIGCTLGGERWSPIVQFEEESKNITPSGDSILIEVAQMLIDNPQILVLEILGYFSHEEPESLGIQRSQAVKDRLVNLGVSEERLDTQGKSAETVFHTKTEISLASDASERSRMLARNRTVHFRVIRLSEK